MTQSEQWAAWVTAIATATQTIAVVGALVVAMNEWRNHKNKDESDRRDAVMKLYFDQSDSIGKARLRILHVDRCVNDKGEISTEPVCKPIADLTWKERIQPISTFQPLFLRVNMCVKVGLCDKNLALELFCSDQQYLRSVFRRYSASLNHGASDGSSGDLAYIDDIFEECFKDPSHNTSTRSIRELVAPSR
jgi:hypothetical protein